MPDPLLHVFLGANAQYIKTAPLLRLMDERGVAYRLIDSGQHVELSARVRRELGVREPDWSMSAPGDVNDVRQALIWSVRLGSKVWSAARLRDDVFGGRGGLCLVHGDTPSTFIAALLARRAGIPVAHLEAGLRSFTLLHPFPEEAVRLAVMRMSTVLYAPDEHAERNLRRLAYPGDVVRVPGNTVSEALRHSLVGQPAPGSGPVVATLHRVENLHSSTRTDQFLDVLRGLAATREVVLVVHGPTSDTLERRGLVEPLRAAGVTVVPLLPYGDFTRMLAAAPFVLTDGGSVQEECALLGTPTLVWRLETERPDGLERNVVLARYDDGVVRGFLADPERFRHPASVGTATPSEQVLADLVLRLQRSTGSADDGASGPRRARDVTAPTP